jgi:protein-L-isoaspartate(D-aspartate) O-methyltransferase
MAEQGEHNQLDRLKMVRDQLLARGIKDQAVLDAFAAVPRELFVPADRRHDAYADSPLPIGYGQTISQPYIVALMVQELGVRSEHAVLDVGAGSGYQTAILARLARHVYALERIPELTERAMGTLAGLNVANVTICTQDGSLGWTAAAPFDRIICGAAGPDVPPAWIDQLAEGGRIIMPVGGRHVQTLVAVDKTPKGPHRREICDVRFVKLIGLAAWPE